MMAFKHRGMDIVKSGVLKYHFVSVHLQRISKSLRKLNPPVHSGSADLWTLMQSAKQRVSVPGACQLNLGRDTALQFWQ